MEHKKQTTGTGLENLHVLKPCVHKASLFAVILKLENFRGQREGNGIL
jgi:hypothetical protein